MKKLLSLLSLAVALSVSALQAADATPLSTTTKNGVTTVTTAGRGQGEIVINADGTLALTVYPKIQRFDSAGEAIAEARLDTSDGFPVTLKVATVRDIYTQIKAAWDAKVAAKLAAEAAAKEAAEAAAAAAAAAPNP